VVTQARKLLKVNPEWCKHIEGGGADGTGTSKFARKDNQHEHGSVDCIRDFLGSENWDHSEVSRILKLADDAELREKTNSRPILVRAHPSFVFVTPAVHHHPLCRSQSLLQWPFFPSQSAVDALFSLGLSFASFGFLDSIFKRLNAEV